MKLSLEILYTSIKDDGLSYGESRTCLATLVFEIYIKQKIVGMWLINFVTHCKLSKSFKVYIHYIITIRFEREEKNTVQGNQEFGNLMLKISSR